MSWVSGLDLLDTLHTAPTASSLIDPFLHEAFVVEDRMVQWRIDHAYDILGPIPHDLGFPCRFPSLELDLFDSVRIGRWGGVRALEDRVAALELGLGMERDREYKWTTEIGGEGKDGVDRKYTCVASAKAGGERSVKWKEEYRGRKKDAASRTYSFQVSSPLAGGGGEKMAKVKGKQKKKVDETKLGKYGAGTTTRVVEITDPRTDQGAVLLKKAFERRTLWHARGKNKELSPEDAAMLIQMSFRAHLIRRSQVLRGLRDLAVAKAKLKEIRALFSNFSYRRLVANDAEERKRFSEKFIVLLLTVDSIKGPDYMVRAAKKSMVEELETMLEMIDPHNPGRLEYLRRSSEVLSIGEL